jgi:hypothetical protein
MAIDSPADLGSEKRKPRGRVSQSDVPRHTLAEALRIAEAISEQFAKQPAKPYYVADVLGVSPTSSRFRTLTGAAVAYGLTAGGYNAAEIGLTDLGRRAVAPTLPGDDIAAQREALMKPRVIREFLERYNDNPLPDARIGRNVLEADMGVDPEAAERTLSFIVDNAQDAGLIKEVAGKPYVDLQAQGASAPLNVSTPSDTTEGRSPADTGGDPVSAEPITDDTAQSPSTDLKVNRRVFITHGKNKKIVDQLKELLTFGDFEPIVSVERESVSKPVPDKVLDDMRSCAAAVIHVGTEQVLIDKEGSEHRVINQNVLIEIGAALMRYGGKFILLVESGTTLPSNLQGLYEVRYEGDELDYPSTLKLLKAFNEFKN